VTSARKFALCIGVIISFLCAGVYAQSAGTKANHFAVEGISFDYPSEYSVKECPGHQSRERWLKLLPAI
jgi:hypothetical protein